MNKIKSDFIERIVDSSSSSNHKEFAENNSTNKLNGKLNNLFQSSIKI